jgi:uncharacterized Zn finger protein (UPF0148 family)
MARKLITCPICGGPLVTRYRVLERVSYRGFGWEVPVNPRAYVQVLYWCATCEHVARVMKVCPRDRKALYQSRDDAQAAAERNVERRKREAAERRRSQLAQAKEGR